VILGDPIAGDGEGTATWRLHGERGEIDLQLELADDGVALRTLTLVPVTLKPGAGTV
jgi:hypothetical protein